MNPNEIAELPPVRRNTIAEMRQVLDAIEQGKEVEYQYVNSNFPDEWEKYEPTEPNFFAFRYRVKPEKRWRPFKDVEEMFLASKLPRYAVYLKRKESTYTLLITAFNDNEVYTTSYGWISVESLLEYYTFADGSPCGVLEEDA